MVHMCTACADPMWHGRAKTRNVSTAVQSAFASAQAAKTERWERGDFLGTARSCEGIYCDPGLLRRGLSLRTRRMCREGDQIWLKKSSTLESFDKNGLFGFTFLGLKAIFSKEKSKKRYGFCGKTSGCRKLNVCGFYLQDMSIILGQVSILEKLAKCFIFCHKVRAAFDDEKYLMFVYM